MVRWLKINNRGMTLTEVVVATGILAVTTIAGIFLNNSNSGKIVKFQKLNELRRQYISNLSFSKSWENTVNYGSNQFQWCRDNFQTCKARTEPMPLSVKDLNNNDFARVNGSNIAFFDNNLNACTDGGNQCPVSAKAVWTPLCNRIESCSQVKLKVEFFYNESKVDGLDIDLVVNYYIGNGAKKEETIYVDVGNSKKVYANKVKIVFIVDNSASMANNLDKLHEQLSRYLNELQGFDFDIHFYTMFSGDNVPIEGDDDVYYWVDLVGMFQPGYLEEKIVKSKWYRKKRYEYLKEARDSLQYEIVKEYETPSELGQISTTKYRYQLKKDVSRQLGIDFNTKSLSLGAQKTALKNIFDRIKTMKSSSTESGMCSLARLLNDTGPNRIMLGDDDRAIFIVLSDENDSTYDGMSALSQYHTWKRPTSDTPCLEAVKIDKKIKEAWQTCDGSEPPGTCATYYEFRVHMKFEDVFNHDVKAVFNDKGELKYRNWGSTENSFDYPFDYLSYASELKYPVDVYSDCDSTIAAKVQASKSDMVLQSCKIRPKRRNGYTFYTSHRGFTESGWSPQLDPQSVLKISSCDEYIEGNEETIFKYYGTDKQADWDKRFRPGIKIKSCSVSTRERDFKNGEIEKLVNAHIKQVFNDWYWSYWHHSHPKYQNRKIEYGGRDVLFGNIEAKHKELLGDDFRFFVSIIHTDPNLCDNDKSGSLGVEYLNYTKSSSSPTEMHNICNNDFGTAVSNLFTRAMVLAKSSYQVNLAEGEYVAEIRVMRGGNLITINRSEYSVFGNNVTFVEGALDDGDELIILIDKV